MRRSYLYTAFVLSGAAGLAYEVVWTRYLGLYVGHSAYAQVLVLAVYLGGMAVGSLSVGGISKRLRSPLLWYAGAELLLAAAGLLFHVAFRAATDFSYDTIFPALSAPFLVVVVRWVLAGALILPQAVVLGTTFPLMAAGLVREDWARPGREVAGVYFANSLGGAIGVLLAGFWLIGAFGLPGTLAAAALLNVAAASISWAVTRPGRRGAESSEVVPADLSARTRDGVSAGAPWTADPTTLARALLVVSFGTAVASFMYEIGWIRMLSMVLGSATHAFELMLSAFILGLALGAWMIRARADRTSDPIRLLGGIQVIMGVAALATLPLYIASFGIMEYLVEELPGRAGGYATFNVGRYAVCLAVMLPSTVMAGMTLPVITGSLLKAGAGEAVIGRVYGWNTLGSVMGVALAGLVLLPVLGLKGLLMAGAALDVAIGIGLLFLSARASRRGPRFALGTSVMAAAVMAVIGLGIHLDQGVLVGGVFRGGEPRTGDAWEVLYYRDGRTATVAAQRSEEDSFINLSTNGKPDASVELRWFAEGRDTLPVWPHDEVTDFTTQVLSPLIALAHAPEATQAANIGHGSGVSGSSLLASDRLERLVTIEIEPRMVEGSEVFLPVNQPIFSDARSTFVFDDAKSFFSSSQDRFDVIFAEPSNPWVSGVATLFSVEFYQHVSTRLTPSGVLGQWIQSYELDDDLFLSILAALDEVFPHYRGYLVATADVAVVASTGPPLSESDWSVLDLDGVRRTMAGAPPLTADHMEALLLFDETTFRSVLSAGVRPNSDYHPVLDLGAERARFMGSSADGLLSFASSRIDLRRNLADERVLPGPYRVPPGRGLTPLANASRAAWLRAEAWTDAEATNAHFSEWSSSLIHLRDFLSETRTAETPASWLRFARDFVRAEGAYHWGTTGWAGDDFYASVYGFTARTDAPPAVRAAVDLMHGVSTWDWELAASAADLLLATVDGGRSSVTPQLLLDAAVITYLKAGRPDAARDALLRLREHTVRADGDLRNRLLEALIEEAG